jgi:hypothetical protein
LAGSTATESSFVCSGKWAKRSEFHVKQGEKSAKKPKLPASIIKVELFGRIKPAKNREKLQKLGEMALFQKKLLDNMGTALKFTGINLKTAR